VAVIDACPFPAIDPARFGDLAKTRVVETPNGLRREVDAEQYVLFAHRIANNFLKCHADLRKTFDDVHQEAMVGLMRSVVGFRPDYGWKFTTYAGKSIWRHLIDDCRASEELTALEFDNLIPDPRDVVGECEEAIDKQAILAPLLAALPPTEAKVIRLRYWEFKTFVEIGETLGRSRQSTKQVHDRALTMMAAKGPLGARSRKCKDILTKFLTEAGPVAWRAARPRLAALGLAIRYRQYISRLRTMYPKKSVG
jgi:RNA polymerase sigma factor (sigma-70 family)